MTELECPSNTRWKSSHSCLFRAWALALHLYIVMKSDLYVVSRTNEIIKFADDTIILVPEYADVGLDVEFRQVSKWADINRLTLNTAKTKEMVFRRPKVKNFHMPPAIDSIEQVDCCKLLGVFFNPVSRWIHMCNIYCHHVHYCVVRECLLFSFLLLLILLLLLLFCMLSLHVEALLLVNINIK